MDANSRPGTRGGWCAGTLVQIARRGRVAACALLLAAAWSAPAAASVLYRCVGAQGEIAYVSHTAGLKHCTRIGSWPKASARRVADQRRDHRPATTMPGKPPKEVKANPAVLKVTPLDDQGSIQIRKLEVPKVWQPFPVAILDTLGDKVLPQLLGMQEPEPEPEPPAPAASAPKPAPPPSAQPIPLKLQANADDAPKKPRTGAVYRVVQKDGSVLYTNVASLAKGRNAKTLFTYIISCYACNVHSRIDWNTVPLKLAAYGDDIRSAARATGVNAALLRAVIHAESGFNARALSYKGAQGLMQLMPGTASDLGVGDAFDPAQNISGGARYLASLLRSYHGDVKLAAAAYNAGAGAVAKYGGIPPYAETQVYVKRVALLYKRYSEALAERGGGTKLAAAAAGMQ